MYPIEFNDKVTFCFDNNSITGYVRHKPNDVGGMWYIEVHNSYGEGSKTYAINPSSAKLKYIIKEE